METLPIMLEKDEKIVREIKPVPAVKWHFFFTFLGLNGVIFVILLILPIPIFFPQFFQYSFITPEGRLFIIFIVGGIIGATIFSFLLATLRYYKEHYWITNKRIISKYGIIGYRIVSLPFERISDILISRTFLERLLGFGSLYIQSLAGQFSRKGLGAETVLLGIENPEEIQQLIFTLIKGKREKERLMF